MQELNQAQQETVAGGMVENYDDLHRIFDDYPQPMPFPGIILF